MPRRCVDPGPPKLCASRKGPSTGHPNVTGAIERGSKDRCRPGIEDCALELARGIACGGAGPPQLELGALQSRRGPVTSAPMLTRRLRPGRHASKGLLRIGGLGRSPCRSCVVRGRTGFADESDSRCKRRRARTPRTSWERERCRVTRGRAAAARRVIRTRGQTAASHLSLALRDGSAFR
jgi:hypothetical protein